MEKAPFDGMILEFCVATGRTINHIARLTDRHVDGFDSFSGLPESWRTGFLPGTFAQAIPAVPKNVLLHKGWFSDTLPSFLDDKSEPVAPAQVYTGVQACSCSADQGSWGRVRAGIARPEGASDAASNWVRAFAGDPQNALPGRGR
jgi:hypothetical protein